MSHFDTHLNPHSRPQSTNPDSEREADPRIPESEVPDGPGEGEPRDPFDTTGLSRDDAAYVRALEVANGNMITRKRLAHGIATCGDFAVVTKKCGCGQYAQAALCTCHDWSCEHCSSAYYRLTQWLDHRDASALCAQPMIAFRPSIHSCSPLLLGKSQAERVRLSMKLSTEFFELLSTVIGVEVDALACAVVDKHKDQRINVLIARTADIARVRNLRSRLVEVWKRVAGENSSLDTLNFDEPARSLAWAFSGMEEVPFMAPERRAEVRLALHGFHTQRITGKRFGRMTDDEWQRHMAKHTHEKGHACPSCQAIDSLKEVPREEQYSASVGEIVDAYKFVRWDSCHPMDAEVRRMRQRRLSSIDPYIGKSRATSAQQHAPPS